MYDDNKKTLLMIKKENYNKNKMVWIELLRIFACFCVILLHVSAKGYKYVGIYSKNWVWYEAMNAFSRIGVCIFVMISSFLFLGNNRGISFKEIKKCLFRILKLIIVWSFLFFLRDLLLVI